jgi:hypothetical protein
MAISVDIPALLFERDGTRKLGIPIVSPGDELSINLDAGGAEKRMTILDRDHLEVTVVSSGAVGWIFHKRVVRDYRGTEPDPVEIDMDLFLMVTLSASRILRVNFHYLLALSHIRTTIKDFRSPASSDPTAIKRIGPFAFSISEWNSCKTDQQNGVVYLERDVFDVNAQPYVAASQLRAAIDAFERITGNDSPDLTTVFFWSLVPALTLPEIVKANDNDLLKDVLLEIFTSDASIGNEAGNIDLLIKADRELFFDGVAPRTIASAKGVAKTRIGAALDETAALITKVPLSEFVGPAGPTEGATVDTEASDLLMKWGENQYVNVYGHLVAKAQRALNSILQPNPPLEVDLVWGKDTAAAMNAWLTKLEKPKSGTLTYGGWRDLTGEKDPELFDLCAQLTASFEGHGFATPVLNVGTNDHGVLTWGFCGFTLAFGHIQKILIRLDEVRPEVITTIAGDMAEPLRQMLKLSLVEQKIWAEQNLAQHGALSPQWKQVFEDLGKNPACQAMQIAYAREEFWDSIALKQAQNLGLITPLSHALLFDISVQNGGLSTEEMEDLRTQLSGAREDRSEEKIRAAIVAKLLDRKSIKDGGNVEAVRGRKRILTSGIGKKSATEGKSYHLGYWGLEPKLSIRETGLDDGPADLTKIAASADFEAFYASQLAATNFIEARHFLFKGNSQARSGNINTDPPQHLWRKIIPVAQLLIDLTNEFQKPISFNSIYRNVAYNRFVDGAPDSRHTHFDAVDFTPQGVSLTQAFNLLDKWRSGASPRFRGGLRKYDTFIHVDTRGANKDW